ncbi:unnamed protein product [Spirodela intermedia]|uniref:Uncharacterized protein n=1 Tax=Spirodela intermedia TaxID=51605 RepID=A0ABN7EAF5_SPIIN|nr:unnamed protein product [Spirodela intermedia]
MAGLLAWAADVVGGGHGGAGGEDGQFPRWYLLRIRRGTRGAGPEAASLRRSIQDLRRRIPPADIAQRLPHLHAHSLASNAALALQLNAHSTPGSREETLQEENTAYEKAILACQKKIQEKLQEASLLQNKLKELDLAEGELMAKLEKQQASLEDNQSRSTFEITVRGLEDNGLSKEKSLEKQLHSLIEQLTAKQVSVGRKEQDLERLSVLWRRLEAGSSEETSARNSVSPHRYLNNGRVEREQKLVVLRSTFVIYILALQLLVFIKISF